VGQDPYGDQAGFTPYQPDATPDGEPPADSGEESAAHPPYVPYSASSGTHAAPLVTTTAKSVSRRALPWLVGVVVLVATCGGGVAGIVGSIAGSDGGSNGTSSDGGLLANDLEAGQCLIGAGLDPDSNDPVSGLEIVDCSTGHDAEVIAVNVLDAEEAAAYDFEDDNGAFNSCKDYFSAAQMELLNRPELFLIALTESQDPARDDKVACLLTRGDGRPLHGSLNDPTPEPPISPS